MEDIQLQAMETTQYIVGEMTRQLPRIAKMLGESPEDLAVLDHDYFPRDYMHSDFRDKVIATDGVLEGLPHIQRRRLQRPGPVGIGIYIYESRLEPDIKYALYVVRGLHGWDETYCFVNKNKVFRLKRHAMRLNKLANRIGNPPVLADGILEEVVQNTVGFLLSAKEIEKYGVKIKRGVILDGPPGNGKTMLCRYIQKLCTQNNINWGVVTSADIDDAYEEKQLNDLFTRFCVTFFDDIDISYMDRTRGHGKMACSLLTAMDGMYDKGHLVRIFTTNEKVDGLDAAFTRPGRIDKCITLEKPDESLRRKLVETYWPEEIRDNINIKTLIQQTHDFSFAEVEAIRTFLVTNKILGDGKWDLTKAFEEFHARRAEKKRKGKKVGFSG